MRRAVGNGQRPDGALGGADLAGQPEARVDRPGPVREQGEGIYAPRVGGQPCGVFAWQPPAAPETLAAIIPDFATVSNPFDYNAYFGGSGPGVFSEDNPGELERCFRVMVDDGYDILVAGGGPAGIIAGMPAVWVRSCPMVIFFLPRFTTTTHVPGPTARGGCAGGTHARGGGRLPRL